MQDSPEKAGTYSEIFKIDNMRTYQQAEPQVRVGAKRGLNHAEFDDQPPAKFQKTGEGEGRVDPVETRKRDSYSFDSKYEVGDCLLSNLASDDGRLSED